MILIYNTNTKKLFGVFQGYGKKANDILKTNKHLSWINSTHPKTKDILADINTVNRTNY